MKSILIGTLATILAAGAQSNEAERQLKAAMNAELVNGDLKSAIKQYGEIAARYAKTDRQVAAAALVHMAECHSKLGDNEARKIYERVVRDFGDQREQVGVARARLAAHKTEAGVTSRKLFDSETLSFPFQALSRDGRYIAYPSIQPGPRGLIVRDLGSGQERQLTNYGRSQLARASAFSPDSRWIAFRVTNVAGGQDMRIIGTDGKGERTIFESDSVAASQPSDWSPDGKHILTVLTNKDRAHQIGIISVTDGSVRRLKTSDWRLGPPDHALYSLDGTQIVYHQIQQEGVSAHDIFLLAADGSRETRLVAHPADDNVVGCAPDGRLLFTSNRSGTRDLFSLRLTGGTVEGEPELIQRNIAGTEHRVTRHGALHYINSHKANGAYISGVDVRNGRLTTPPVTVTETTRDYNWAPAFSPDGSKVAVISFRGVGRIYVILKSLASNEEREVYAEGLRVAYDLLWHPDGKSLLIRGANAAFQWGIHRLDLATGRLENVLKAPGENSLGQYEVSPDGKFIYYHFMETQPMKSIIRSRNVITGEERDLYQAELSPGALFSFALAPGGKRIALVNDRDWQKPDAATWTMLDIGTGTTRQIPNLNRGTFAPVWTPDEEYLVFVSGQSWFRATVRDGSLAEIGPTGLRGIRATKRMHPDGTRLAFFTVKEISEFWVLENLFPTQVGRR